jgi:hypothetical protein
MGFSVFGKGHTSPLYGFLPSADIGQVVYSDKQRAGYCMGKQSGFQDSIIFRVVTGRPDLRLCLRLIKMAVL